MTHNLSISDFSGGLNIRDAPTELAANELSDAFNVTLDERGGVAGRLGYMKWNPTPYNVAAKVQNTYYWEGARKLITQVGASMYEDQSVGAFYANTTSARVAMTEFAGLLLWVHPVDGVVAWNGATYQVIAGSPPGSTIAVWQNKVWVSGAGDTRVRWSAPGDHTSWPAGNFVDLREKDTAAVVCLGLPGGTDIVGRSGLLAFKNRSTYRIYDSSNGAFQTIDPSTGAASALSVTSAYGRIYVLSERGIFETDGTSRLVEVSGKISPLFDPAQINFAQLNLACAGRLQDRLYFSFPGAGDTSNTRQIEYSPLAGWMVLNSNPATCYATYGKDTQALLSGSPGVNAQVYKQLTGGTDDGAGITGEFRTRWFELNDGMLARLRRVRVTGRGNFTAYVLKNYDNDTSLGATRSVALNPSSTQVSLTQDLLSLGVARAFAFHATAETSFTVNRPPWQGGSTGRPASWVVYDLDFKYIPLGTK